MKHPQKAQDFKSVKGEQYLRLGPVLFLSAGGGGRAKLLQGCPGGRV